MRQFGEATYQGLRTATRRLIRAAGRLEAAAEATRVSRTTLAAYYEPTPTRAGPAWMPIDVAADLEEVSGRPLVTAALARLSGHLLLRVRPDRAGALARDVARVARETAELLAAYEEALADGADVNPREAARILEETDQALAALMGLRAELLGRLEERDG